LLAAIFTTACRPGRATSEYIAKLISGLLMSDQREEFLPPLGRSIAGSTLNFLYSDAVR
jgi:hypothetical protein